VSFLESILKDCMYLGSSLKFEYNNEGKKTGVIIIAFCDTDKKNEAKKHLNSLNKKPISSISSLSLIQSGSSNLDLEIYNSTVSEYEKICNSMANTCVIDKISFLISSEKITRSILVKGIPLKVTVENLLSTLSFLNIARSNLIKPEYLIANFGCCIIEFENEEICNEASDFLCDETFIFEKKTRGILKVESMLSIINKKQ
jgi:hypothetical protein